MNGNEDGEGKIGKTMTKKFINKHKKKEGRKKQRG